MNLVDKDTVKRMLDKKFGHAKDISSGAAVAYIEGGRTDMFGEIDQMPSDYSVDVATSKLEERIRQLESERRRHPEQWAALSTRISEAKIAIEIIKEGYKEADQCVK